jgi:hypothetical protein
MLKLVWEIIARQYVHNIEEWTISRGGVWKGFKLAKVELDWSPGRVTSRGGMYKSGPGINIAMNRYTSRIKLDAYRVYEYKSFDSDPEIGGFFTTDPQDGLKMIICHEMAHACQYYLYSVNKFRDAPHGDTFKRVYREIRQEFLNPYIKEQEHVKELFCKQATDSTKLAYSEL